MNLSLNYKYAIGGTLVSALFVLSCQISPKDEKKEAPTWSGSMRELEAEIREIMPLVVDMKKFNKPSNKEKIKERVSAIKASAKSVESHPTMPGRDLTMRFISQAFVEDIQKIDEAISSEKWDYARYSLMHVTAYCIECHTRTSSGPSFSSERLESTLASLEPFERGEYLLSTRKYLEALSSFRAYVSSSLEKGTWIMKVDQAIRYSLAITIKYLESPAESKKVLSWLEHPKTPYYLKSNAIAWKRAINEWEQEKDLSYRKSVSQILKHVRKLVHRGNLASSGVEDGAGEVYWMRALSELHRVLSTHLNEEQRGEALYLTGLSYEKMRDLALWNLHENYYESCIRSAQHSVWARRCYDRLEESILIGYSGSSGVRIPHETQRRLLELKKLSETKVQ